MPVGDPNGLASGSREGEESCDLTVVGTAERSVACPATT